MSAEMMSGSRAEGSKGGREAVLRLGLSYHDKLIVHFPFSLIPRNPQIHSHACSLFAPPALFFS